MGHLGRRIGARERNVNGQSSTLLDGLMIDKAQFKKDLDRIVRHSKQQARK